MAEIPKRPTDDWAPHAYAVDLIEHEHAVAVRAVEALEDIELNDYSRNSYALQVVKKALREIEESGWKP